MEPEAEQDLAKNQVKPKPPPSEEVSQFSDEEENKGQRKKKLIITCLAILLIISLVAAAYYYLKLQRKPSYLTRGPIEKETPQEISPIPISPNEKEDLTNDIQTRSHVDDQKNIGLEGTVSSGFLKPSMLKKKTSLNKQRLLVKSIYAEEEERLLPFLFYVKNKIQIKAFDLSSGIEYELLDLRDFPNISIKEHTQIVNQYFLNNSKQIAFQVQEQLEEDRYKISFNLYNLKTQELTEIVSTLGTGAENANWRGFSVSPDERYLFALYINPYETDPFSEVPNPVTTNPSYYDDTYIFYDLTNNTIKKFKLDQRLASYVLTQWSEDSQSVLVFYRQYFDPQEKLVFFRVFPTGRYEVVLEISNPDREIRKGQYFRDSGKIFYIATGSTRSEATFHQELFGYIDLSTGDLNDINALDIHSLQFIYDFSGGFIFDTFTRENGVVTNRVLNRYDIETTETKQITDVNVFIINFNGDYDHLLVSQLSGQQSYIYDLNIKTGALQYLATVPTIISY